MLKKVLDTNIIVYSILEDHPASQVCDSLIRDKRYSFYTTTLTPFEVYFVLRRIYGVEREEASSKALSLFKSPLIFTEIRPQDAKVALKRCIDYDLDVNDSLLIQACLNSGIPSLASDDRRLLKISEVEGIHPQSPIQKEHREKMQQWEKEKLLLSGLPRILKRIHIWLGRINPQVAQQFLESTGELRHLP
ncbi:MAG: type II toxin-antitoxin system VapC family toxin [archaeon]|nr:type II toxin-antitoxin system VapC family toxin [archaeon]